MDARRGQPFRRAHVMAAMIGAIMAAHGGNAIAAQAALAQVGPYEGRGKGKTRTHDGGGTRAHQRLAQKQRNRSRNRLAHRG
jgi:hypothetical protein